MASQSGPPVSLLSSLSKLKTLIKKLPSSCPSAPKHGDVHRHFSTYDVPDGESAYFTVDQAWNRVFQGKQNVPIGGKYGVGVIYDFFSHFAKQELGNDFALLELRVTQFIELVENCKPTHSKEPETQESGPPKRQVSNRGTTAGSAPGARSPLTPSSSTKVAKPALSKEGEKEQDDVLESGNNLTSSTTEDSESYSDKGTERSSESDEETDTDDEVVEIPSKGFKSRSLKKSSTASKKPSSKPNKPPSNAKASVQCSRSKSFASRRRKPVSPATKKSNKSKPSRKRSTTKNKSQASNKTSGGADDVPSDKPLSGSSGSEAEDGDMVDVPRGGRKPVKATWAFEQFSPTPGTSRAGEPIWVWHCQWCPVMRTTPRTSKIKEYSKETLPRPKSSNFISHLSGPNANCRIPEEAQYENIGKELPASSEGTLQPAGGYAAQRKIILDFTERGKAFPARKPVTKDGFRAAFVKGVIEDGLPFTFGEGHGMKKLFGYSLPEFSLPKRMTVRRDLDVLHTALQTELWGMIKSLKSRPSIAFDIWSSRNSVYAFIGLKVFWISPDWVLKSHLLDLIHLDDDHGGATAGRLIFSALKESGVAEKMSTFYRMPILSADVSLSALHLLGSAADNATSNGVAHRAIAKRKAKAFKVTADPKLMGLGCAGHVIHLTAQDLLAAFEVMEPSNAVDYFHDTNRQYGLYYSAETDPDIIAQEAEFDAEDKRAQEAKRKRKAEASKAKQAAKEKSWKRNGPATLVSDSDGDHSATEHNFTDSENEESDESDCDWDDEDQSRSASGVDRGSSFGGLGQNSKRLNPLQKIHSFASYVTRSAIRRQNFRRFVEKHCPSDCHRLGLVKGMEVRWNSKYSEYKRAYKLRLAIDAYIAQMTEGKTGKKLDEARKQQGKLYMSFPEWDLISQLCDVLEVFQVATLDLSRSDVPTLPMVLPLYKQVEVKLEQALKSAQESTIGSMSISKKAYEAALNKLAKYIAAACESPLHLIATALHPAMRLAWFEDRSYWPSAAIATRVRVLLTTMYTEYAEQYDKERAATSSSASRQQHSQQPPPQQSKASSLLATAISLRRPHQSHEAELESYFRGALGCQRWDDLLSWWKMNEQTFPVLSRMARDVLAAPGVSISVERLFSVCRHVMTESRTAMTAKTASKTVCAKEWLHEGLGSTIDSFSGLPAAHD